MSHLPHRSRQARLSVQAMGASGCDAQSVPLGQEHTAEASIEQSDAVGCGGWWCVHPLLSKHRYGIAVQGVHGDNQFGELPEVVRSRCFDVEGIQVHKLQRPF